VARIDADRNPVIAFERMNCSSVSALLSLDLRPRFLLLAVLTCATIPVLADTVVIRGDRVNVRSQPSLEGEVLAWMKRGETVETQASSKDGFIRIALPPKVAVWVYGPLVDRVSHQVKAPEARLRVGPGRNYGELGVLKKGATLTEIRESDGWLQVEPPAGLSAYVGAQFIEPSVAPVAKFAAVKTGGILPADGDPVSRTVPDPALSKPPAIAGASVTSVSTATTPPPSAPVISMDPVSFNPGASRATSGGQIGDVAQSSIQYSSEKVRIVTRVGKVARSLEPQSPSHYQLRSPLRGEGMLGFLVGQDPQTPIAKFRGKTVQVVAEEYVNPGNRTQVLLRVQSIEEAPLR
jgi:SH3-like domain-containing protein